MYFIWRSVAYFGEILTQSKENLDLKSTSQRSKYGFKKSPTTVPLC